MVLSKVLFSIELLALVGVLFFLPATFLVEQKGDLNGRKSRFRGGVFLCVIIYALSVLLRVVQTGTIKMPQRDLGYETIYLVSGGISSLASILFGVAIFCIYKLQKKTNTRAGQSQVATLQPLVFGCVNASVWNWTGTE